MAPRAFWKGFLKLSLVSCPIQLIPAISEREKIRFHLINRRTGNRLKYAKVDAVTGESVPDVDIVKGYEVSKGHYIQISEDELEAVAIGSRHTIEIERFVARTEIDELYWNVPYYIFPDGEVGRQAFAVIREAIRNEGMVALGSVVFTTREHVMAMESRGQGIVGVTLRYPYEIRNEAIYSGHLSDEAVPEDMLDLAVHIVRTKAGRFDPDKFEDRYEKALKALIERKRRGEKIERAKRRTPAKVVSLMDALHQSVAAARAAAHSRRPARRYPRTASTRKDEGADPQGEVKGDAPPLRR
jgi:DNA end-binding protein Ku